MGQSIWPTLATRFGALIKTQPGNFVLAGFGLPEGASWIGEPKWSYREAGVPDFEIREPVVSEN